MNIGAGGTASAFPWPWLLQPYIKSTQIFVCPSDTSSGTMNSFWANGLQPANLDKNFHVSYAYNDGIGGVYDSGGKSASLSAVDSVATTVAVFDAGTEMQGTNSVTTEPNPLKWTQRTSTPYGTSAKVDKLGESMYGGPHPRHLETTNVLFADGHVKSQRVDSFYKQPGNPTLVTNVAIPCLDITTGCK